MEIYIVCAKGASSVRADPLEKGDVLTYPEFQVWCCRCSPDIQGNTGGIMKAIAGITMITEVGTV